MTTETTPQQPGQTSASGPHETDFNLAAQLIAERLRFRRMVKRLEKASRELCSAAKSAETTTLHQSLDELRRLLGRLHALQGELAEGEHEDAGKLRAGRLASEQATQMRVLEAYTSAIHTAAENGGDVASMLTASLAHSLRKDLESADDLETRH